jgi:hypothetical protein
MYLFSNPGDMIFNRFFGDMERIGNLLIGQAFQQFVQNLTLPAAQFSVSLP